MWKEIKCHSISDFVYFELDIEILHRFQSLLYIRQCFKTRNESLTNIIFHWYLSIETSICNLKLFFKRFKRHIVIGIS